MKSTLWLGLAVLSAGCVVHTGSLRYGSVHETKAVSKSKAEMVSVDVSLGAGTLRLEGGATGLMQGDFTSPGGVWKPDVRYEESGFRGHLLVKQTHPGGTLGDNGENRWQIRLADDVPMDLNISLGAGEGHLQIGSLALRSVQMKVGAGRVDMDLRGDPKKSYDVTVHGGIGEATVRVPSGVGVIADAKGGIGEIHVEGLHRDGSAWVNDAYGRSRTTIRLEVRGGIGQINILGG